MKKVAYMCQDVSSLGSFLQTLLNAQQIATSCKFDNLSVATGKSHAWVLARYSEEDQAIKHVYNIIQMNVTGKLPTQEGIARTASGSTTQLSIDPIIVSFLTGAARSEWIHRQLMQREEEFTELKPVTVKICSWNVGAVQGPVPASQLRQWLGNEEDCDLFSVGLQEVVKLNTNALMVKESSSESRAWLDAISSTIGVPDKYIVLVSRQYVGIYHFLAARRELVVKGVIRDVQCKAAGCGILGQFGNKGAISIRATVYNTAICFVCSHLAAGKTQVGRRNFDQMEISRRTIFSNSTRGLVYQPHSNYSPETATIKSDLHQQSSSSLSSNDGLTGPDGSNYSEYYSSDVPATIEGHDIIFWFGDLNYRIEVARQRALELIQSGSLEELYNLDQLFQQRMEGNAFLGYKEARPNFLPTYKYDVGTDEYDTSEKQRAPAWCDRILWNCKRGSCKQECYSRHELTASDHRPVSAKFNLEVTRVLTDKLSHVAEQVSRSLDHMDNQCTPNAELDIKSINFYDVRYRCAQKQSATLRNMGQVFVHYRFILDFLKEDSAKKWLAIEPRYGLLMPGESRSIVFKVRVGDEAARVLRGIKQELQETIVLQVEGGNTLFVTITAQCLSTAYGRGIDELVTHRYPIRYSGLHADGKSGKVMPLPKEIWRLAGAIFERGLKDDNIFLKYGEPKEVFEIRECIDTGAPFADHLAPASFAAALIQLLRSLPSPVIPAEIRVECVKHHQSKDKCFSLLSQMPPVNLAVLVYLVSLLRELFKHREENKLSPETLALIFSAVLMYPETVDLSVDDPSSEREVMTISDEIEPRADLTKEQAILLHLLRNDM
eukprot:6721-Hanusia_phi.AAC.1